MGKYMTRLVLYIQVESKEKGGGETDRQREREWENSRLFTLMVYFNAVFNAIMKFCQVFQFERIIKVHVNANEETRQDKNNDFIFSLCLCTSNLKRRNFWMMTSNRQMFVFLHAKTTNIMVKLVLNLETSRGSK